jgi:amino acid transporter
MDSPIKTEVGSQELIRGMGLWSATALNMIDMIGVGPFITMPLVVAAMGGPQALLGWIAGALLAVCDGLVSAELGAALPASGGTYRYLREMYGPQKWGRLISFLFIWQVSFSAPLSIATGCIGRRDMRRITGRASKRNTRITTRRCTFHGPER